MTLQAAQLAKTAFPAFTPVPSGLLQRKCAACGTHTPGGGTCSKCTSENSATSTLMSSIKSRDGDFETQTQTRPGTGLTPATPSSSNHCSISSATFTSIPNGTLVPTISGGRLSAPFNMRATFGNAIPCHCGNGEYRQYVRGAFTADGRTLTHALGPGRDMSPTEFQEDGDVGLTTAYGHRATTGDKDHFRPDDATGCDYEGEDAPGLGGRSGSSVSMNLDFRGELIDTSDSNRVVTSKSWSVVGSATLP